MAVSVRWKCSISLFYSCFKVHLLSPFRLIDIMFFLYVFKSINLSQRIFFNFSYQPIAKEVRSRDSVISSERWAAESAVQ